MDRSVTFKELGKDYKKRIQRKRGKERQKEGRKEQKQV